MMRLFHAAPTVVVALLLIPCNGGSTDHRYKQGEHVELWVNKVFPYSNPQEAYEYYTLPYCAPDNNNSEGRWNEWKVRTIGEHLGGYDLRHSGHNIAFEPNSQKIEACETNALTEEEAQKFAVAIRHRRFYQMYLDDLPVWNVVGEMLPPFSNRLDHTADLNDTDANDYQYKPYVYTSRTLTVSYNGDQIVKVDLVRDPKSLREVKVGVKLTFDLRVQWKPTKEEFHSRFERYLDHEFFNHPIHSFTMVLDLFLIGLVALTFLHTLRRDYARYKLLHDVQEAETNNENVDDNDNPIHSDVNNKGSEDTGWKQVHGDVFRAPPFLPFFSALIGSGWQLVTLTLGVILYAIMGRLHRELHEKRGEVIHAILVCYSLSSVVAGYQSERIFKLYYPTTEAARRNTEHVTMGLTVVLIPTVTVSILSVLNNISWSYGTINTIPFLVIAKLFFIWAFVSVPLCVAGTLLGRHARLCAGLAGTCGGTDHFPCRVNAILRPIPEEVPWYGKPLGLILLAGLLSFCSISNELFYVLTSLWNYKFYHVYGYLLGVFAILAIVVGMTSIIVVYFCWNAENWHWQWTAFGSGASTGVYVFLYSIYYFFFKTTMHGFLQTSFYFGYMGLISIHLGLLCGALGYAAASGFVRTVFQSVKVN